MIETTEHPDVTEARERVRPILEAIDAAAAPEIARLQHWIARTDGEAREDYADQLCWLLADVRRQREMVIKPVLDIAAVCAPTIIIHDPNASNAI